MACYFADNVHTRAFTPREYQVELVDAAKERNVAICLNAGTNKSFVLLKVVQELSNEIRLPWFGGGKRTLYVGTEESVEYYAHIIGHLTDLKVGTYLTVEQDVGFASHQVLFATWEVCTDWVARDLLNWSRINLFIVDGCHNVIREHSLRQLVQSLNQAVDAGSPRPRILGLTKPLFTSGDIDPGCIEAKVKQLERDLRIQVDTASDIVSTLRYSAHPKEYVVECSSYPICSLSELLKAEVNVVLEFLGDHRYDPTEIYDDCFTEELRDVPDPKKDPYDILDDFLDVLDNMGPWCADKAALVLLVQIEKLKVKTPYERHFLLLCIVSTALFKIRAICDSVFEELPELDRIVKYSSPKILRLIEIVRQFKPKRRVGIADSTPSTMPSTDSCDKSTGLSVESEADAATKDSTSGVEGSYETNDIDDPITDRDEADDESKIPAKQNNSICFICGKMNCCGKPDESPSGDLAPCSTEVENSNSGACNGASNQPSGTTMAAVSTGGERIGRRNRWRGRGRFWRHRRQQSSGGTSRPVFRSHPRNHHGHGDETDNLCGIIFVHKRFTAKMLYHLFHDLRKSDPDFVDVNAQYTVGKVADPVTEPREAEIEHRKQEEVLKRFRMRDCNLVVTTSVLEEGIELPRCNLIIRYDAASEFKSHANSKSRARHHPSHFIVMIESTNLNTFLATFSKHISTERLLLSRSANNEPSVSEEIDADAFTEAVPAYKPSSGENGVKVTLSTAISLVNRYCAKLPSDTFTRLAPLWWTEEINIDGKILYFTSVRLPINSPVKETIVGHPMPTRVLSRRIAALETCRRLHQQGELDDNFEPIGKEAFNSGFELEDLTPSNWDPNLPRPGTTKSRQYYYKRIASCLNDCRPSVGKKCILYNIDMVLTCPLPEEQNTRGRRLHPPELAPQAFGILTLKKMPKICPFPIFTRSGEVKVNLSLCNDSIVLTERHIQTIAAFLNFIFTSVLRLQKYLMSFDPEATENSFFIVPTKKNADGVCEVDWAFLELIYEKRNEGPTFVQEEDRKNFQFDSAKYTDAVVMPWYRNQDQPQYFYVAEICTHLSPKSAFPGSDYNSFEDYYLKKYSIQIQNSSQPLLDVDHTSARLNFLTPRYVNRKGVALPTSSEETKKAKRENLEQKQILVAELCSVHVLPASLWRQAVCLPCILYRINALLLADEIRLTVAGEIGLGVTSLSPDFDWPPLDFGWSLADVLKKSNDEKENKKEASLETIDEGFESNSMSHQDEVETEPEDKSITVDKKSEADDESDVQKEDEEKEKDDGWMEIGTWSNEMAHLNNSLSNDLPDNLTMVRYGSPTSWNVGVGGYNGYYSDVDSEDTSDDEDEDSSSEISDTVDANGDGTLGVNGDRLRITFKGDFLAEAVEVPLAEGAPDPLTPVEPPEVDDWVWDSDDILPSLKEVVESEGELFRETSERTMDDFKNDGILIPSEMAFVVERRSELKNTVESVASNTKPILEIEFAGKNYSMPAELCPSKAEKLQCPVVPYCSDLENCEDEDKFDFSFDYQPELEGHPGPSPSLLLQALTMSNANDGINLERLETIGDSFLKYAITTYLYCLRDNVHEGKLSHLRSKQVSNLKLYRLGQKKVFGESMIASKFEPHDNWLPPCYLVPRDAERELLDSEPLTSLPYNLVTQHSIPDKSIADCVEALIGAYLIECGPRGALIFMSWLGIKVLPKEDVIGEDYVGTQIGVSLTDENGVRVKYGELEAPRSPLLRHVDDPEGELMQMMAGFDFLERQLCYSFNDKSYLLQAMTHASYSPNRLTDCYQRLEFLGDAVLDYLITRHLYEDKRAHSPGALTDLRSALVNNTIFASLAVKYGFHKYFRHLSPGLGEVVQRFVTIQEENSHAINEEFYLVGEEAEDVEVPKALGDVFESIAGAIYLDSKMSLDAVWRVYYRMMKKEIEQFSTKVPKSPIRELLELEPETAKFSKPEKLADGRRVRVTVEVFGKGTFKGIGRNYRIAKCTAAKCALKQLKKKGLLARKLSYYHSAYLYQR